MSWRQILESDCVWFELAGGGAERVGDQRESQENEVCYLSLKEHVFEKKEKVSVKYHIDVKYNEEKMWFLSCPHIFLKWPKNYFMEGDISEGDENLNFFFLTVNFYT